MSRSLQCVKKHKMEHSCEGRRCKTAYTSLSEFDDAQLLSGKLSSDYVHPVHATGFASFCRLLFPGGSRPFL